MHSWPNSVYLRCTSYLNPPFKTTTSQGNPGISTFYDALETRSPAEREAALMAALPQQIAHAQKASPAFASILAGVDVVRSPAARHWPSCP